MADVTKGNQPLKGRISHLKKDNIAGSHWESCYYCPKESFRSSADFVKHLRDRHCTKEGGSFVCRYGFNGVCSSLPLDGVSDRDYEIHVTKYHLNQMSKEQNLPPVEWSIFSAAQNLPAVLNDPSRGKQTNLFTKKWGDSFVERAHIGPSPHLPDITNADFEIYMKKIGKRYRRHVRIAANQSAEMAASAANDEKYHSTRYSSSSVNQSTNEGSLNEIPEIFMKSTLNLNDPQTFASVFPGIVGQANEESKQSGRLLQEKLSHYLDIVEVKIARQVSLKSGAFFNAMTSQDAIMQEMQQATKDVRSLRDSLKLLSQSIVVDSFKIIRYAQRRKNYMETLDKLSLMSTVQKTQPMLQLLLGTQDYVAALDLIGTTQEVLTQELMGVHCFKHLPMQLNEMEKLIDKMLTTEFKRYASTDLNRPHQSVVIVDPATTTTTKTTDQQDQDDADLDAAEDKLVCIIMGLLRKKNFTFIDLYKEEAITTIRAIIKHTVIEVISTSDAEICLTGAGEEAQSLSTISEWIDLLQRATIALLAVLKRFKAVTTIMLQAADAAAGIIDSNENHNESATASSAAVNLISNDSEIFLTNGEHEIIRNKLNGLLQSVCNYCHERCSNLVSSQSLEKIIPTADDIERLSDIISDFSNGCELICGIQSIPLNCALREQASRFANNFHSERKQKLALLLDSERWRQVDIPNEFQKIIDRIAVKDFAISKPAVMISEFNSKTNSSHTLTNGNGSSSSNNNNNNNNNISNNYNIHHIPSASPVLLVEGKPYTLVGAALLLVQMISEYCKCAMRLPIAAGFLTHYVVDLLRTFNSRSCQLVIGAGALHVAGLKTITSGNLALVSRALQLILWLLPKIKEHFQSLDVTVVGGFDSIEKDYIGHVKEIENKIHSIVTERITLQLTNWDARPPVPSQSFRLISRHLVKLHEAIAPILPADQIHLIYGVVHKNFKDKLREKLLQYNITNNGGPQHGVVTSELTFYMETLRTLKALPPSELSDDTLEDVF